MNISMQQHIQPDSYKISLSKMTKDPLLSFNSRPIPSLPNHISWQQQQCPPIQSPPDRRTGELTRPKRRRRIFENQQMRRSASKSKVVRFETSQERQEIRQKQLQKVKSTNVLIKHHNNEENDLQKRLLQVNQRIARHRQSKAHISPTCSERKREEDRLGWSKFEEKLGESTVLMRRQQEMLNSKIPSFEQKIEANNHAICQISQLIHTKFEENSQSLSKMMELANKSESRLKIKEEELSRINSELLYKELELMRNKQQSKKRQLELIRMKRIEDLQNKNLELYQSIEKQSFRQFQDLVVEENDGVVEGQVWEDEEEPGLSKLSCNQQSTIRYVDPRLDSSRSANHTLGEILSPLALSHYQY